MIKRAFARIKSRASLFTLILFTFVLITAAGLVALEWEYSESIQPDLSPTLWSADGRLLRLELNRNEQRLIEVTPEEMHPRLVRTVLAVEDRRFYYHPGIDPFALLRAVYQNLTRGKIHSGASTVTMQLARMQRPAPRTLTNKFREVVRALLIETRYDKNEILRAYLNRLPFGGNIRGVQTAARAYFGRNTTNINWSQAATLAAIPRDPVGYDPRRHPDRLKNRRNLVLGQLREQELINLEQFKRERNQPLGIEVRPFPTRAPHFVELFRNQLPGGRHEATLHYRDQLVLEATVRDARSRLQDRGIDHVAVVVIDNRTRTVRAYEGSGDFWSANGGQIQGGIIRRSPGSTLKPFLFGMALEKGTILPSSRIVDVPTRYASFRPENFDRKFHGFVSAGKALSDSLNIPAVRLLEREGVAPFLDLLRSLGMDLPGRAGKYGLGLTLGSGEITLAELTNAYATFAEGGEYRSLHWLKTNQEHNSQQIFSPGVSYLVTAMLRQTSRRGTGLQPAVKTGTSTGRRDAWTVAMTPELTVGVWTGNFDYSASKALVGQTAARPLALAVLQNLHSSNGEKRFSRPGNLESRKVCAISGEPANRFCPRTEKTMVPLGHPRGQECDIHKRIIVSEETGYRHCAFCRPDSYEHKVVEDLPSLVSQFYRERGMESGTIPLHDPTCPYSRSGVGEITLSKPANGAQFRADRNARIPVRPVGPSPDDAIYLFVNGVHRDTLKSGEVSWLAAEEGEHSIRVVDERGRMVEHKIVVK